LNESAIVRFRACLVFTFLLGVLGALAGRLFWVQVVEHERFLAASRSQHVESEKEPAPRGDILDRHGRPLAASRLLPSVAVDPAHLRDRDEAATLLAEALGVDRESLARRFASPTSRFAWVRRGVDDPDAIARVKALDLRRRPASPKDAVEDPLIVRYEMGRCYPTGPLASQVLGFVGIDGIGLEGLESVLEKDLHGVDGERAVLRDALGQPIAVPSAESTPAVAGKPVRLTIDAVIQGFAEDALRATCEKHTPKGGVCVVLDARTGEALALASWPTYDPARPGAAGAEARRARYVTDMFEPGSSFKPLVAAAAIECGAVAADERIDCGMGSIRIGSRTVHEHEDHRFGRIPVETILAVSSNCGMARMAVRVGIPRMQAALAAFGFGRPTGLGLRGEVAGRLTPPERWTESYTLVSVSFGQEIAVTPMQLAAAYLPVAGDGTLPKPSLILPGTPAAAPERVRVLSPATARSVRHMLERVLLEGTARSVPKTGYRLAGKTGTAQKMKGGESVGNVSSFVALGPVQDPRLVCLVLLDEPSRKLPYTGGKVAAPYCAEVLRRSLRYLGVRPDEVPGDRP
jgi:cell division protein FtsI/penicillin-binding protein 2